MINFTKKFLSEVEEPKESFRGIPRIKLEEIPTDDDAIQTEADALRILRLDCEEAQGMTDSELMQFATSSRVEVCRDGIIIWNR